MPMTHSFRSCTLYLLVLFLLVACGGSRNSVKSEGQGDPRWTSIDSLAGIGQYATALEKVEALRAEAAGTGDWRTEFRTWIRRSEFQLMTGVERRTILAEMGDRANAAPAPLGQLLHSARAEGWWNYYRDDRWTILSRTELGAVGSDDPETWTQQRFMAEVIGAFRASLEPFDALAETPVGELGDLLQGDTATWKLRDKLFDVLAQRALTVFTDRETRITEPAWRFQLDNPSWFDLFDPFAWRQLNHRDSTAWEFQAMRLFQHLERSHLNDDKLDAYVDVVMQRLAHVRAHSTLANKDSLYLGALELLRTRVPLDACEAEVMVAIAHWHEQQASGYDRLAGVVFKNERRTALELCDAALTKWPGSFGARNAFALKSRLEHTALQVRTEEAVPANKPFRAVLQFTNSKQVWLRVVKDPFDLNKTQRWDRDHGQFLATEKPVREWTIALPDDGDLNEHVVELPVEGLPFDRYALLACNTPDFRAGTDVISWCNLQVTDLAMVQRQAGTDLDLLVLDRTTGKPKGGVKARAHVRNEDYTGVERFIGLADLVTDADGMVRTNLKGRQGEVRWWLDDGDDRLMGSPFWVYTNYENQPDSLRLFLFTDRAIYRPGQELFVKGIATVKRGGTTEVKRGYSSILRFFAANGEVIDSLSYTTDAFGSFSVRFSVPQGGLTGMAQLVTDFAQKQVRIEEYKRPLFEVTFDPITTTPKLGETATVTGMAKSYAGAPLDGANVKYTVTRSANMPWWCGWNWRGLPWGRSTEIASGTTTCDAAGKFNVAFLAQADNAFARDADPSFTYTVEAWATDINGETQTANTSLTVGYRTIDINIDLGEALDRSKADSLRVRVTNLNGQPVEVPFEVRMTKLIQPPGGVKRDRMWERPDRFVIAAAQHDSLFPGEVYDKENDPATWVAIGDAAMLHSGSAHGKAIPLRGIRDREVGTYRLDARAVDPNGREVQVQKVITLFDPEIQNTGFENEAFHVEVVNGSCEPGEKAVLLLSSALPECRVTMEVEREGSIVVRRPFILRKGQQRVELPVLDTDRGGFTVHFVCVERGRDHNDQQYIDVPWSNKQLHMEWMSFRDKLLPGAKEEWRLKITGPKKEKVAAQVLAAMYDASLDQFALPDWWMQVWENNYPQRSWGRCEPMGAAGAQAIYLQDGWIGDSTRNYVRLIDDDGDLIGLNGRYSERFRTVYSPSFGGEMDGRGANRFSANGDAMDGAMELEETTAGLMDQSGKKGEDRGEAANATGTTSGGPALRTDFRETAFFFPDLLTDHDGNVVLRFTMPDALTRWNFMGLAHTRQLQLVQFNRSTITQKPLMVAPNLPRFLRQGDRIILTTKINVIEGREVNGFAKLELFDPYTNKAINGAFALAKNERAFTAAPGKSASVSWSISVPEGVEAVAVRITAGASVMNDGEERVLPILTDKVLVTESVPLAITKAGTKSFSLPNLLTSGSSNTLQHRSLTLEFTPNPAWYAVQALPYLMEFPHECAEQIFSRYYANHLAAHIVSERPVVKKVFDAWSKGTPGNEGAFLSALEKNPELKGVLLEETPWVMNAKDEGERKRRIALFFDLQRMATEEASSMKKLADMQLSNGAWPWWSGMQPNRAITQHIVAGFGHLQQLGALDPDPDSEAGRMVRNAVQWLDKQVEDDHQRMRREFRGDTLPMPSAEDFHYLYARSCFPQIPLERKKNGAVEFIVEHAQDHWLRLGMQEQGMIALALSRLEKDSTVPKLIMTSLAQRATLSEELGMYWKDFRAGYRWNEFPTEMHALMIEAFDQVAHDREKVDALRQYLLKLKQTTDWKTTKATADACYALLLTGDDWLAPEDPPAITVGDVALSLPKGNDAEAGTGYFEKSWPGDEVKPTMGQVTVTTTSDGVQWGALHWQYFEQMDKVRAHESPFSLHRQVMLNEQTEAGARLVALGGSRSLKPGDKLTVRVELRTDRYLDLVHLKDLHAAGLDATQTLSGYQWKGGLGYYLSIRDAAMHFFFDRIAPGTYVFEYDLKVTHSGAFSNGITSVECMYAPEFSSHSEGLRIEVKE